MVLTGFSASNVTRGTEIKEIKKRDLNVLSGQPSEGFSFHVSVYGMQQKQAQRNTGNHHAEQIA